MEPVKVHMTLINILNTSEYEEYEEFNTNQIPKFKNIPLKDNTDKMVITKR